MNTVANDSKREHSIVARIDRQVARFENGLGILLVITVTVVVLLQITFRFFLNSPLSWSGELATYILVWLTFLGLAIAQRDKAHVALHILPDLNGVAEQAVNWLRWIAGVVLFAVMGGGGLALAFMHNVESSPAMGLPIWAVYLGLPLGGVLGLWHLMLDLPGLIRGDKEEQRWH